MLPKSLDRVIRKSIERIASPGRYEKQGMGSRVGKALSLGTFPWWKKKTHGPYEIHGSFS
jgi:hypothetical protein